MCFSFETDRVRGICISYSGFKLFVDAKDDKVHHVLNTIYRKLKDSTNETIPLIGVEQKETKYLEEDVRDAIYASSLLCINRLDDFYLSCNGDTIRGSFCYGKASSSVQLCSSFEHGKKEVVDSLHQLMVEVYKVE